MGSRRRQRSIALNHIPPVPIPHGLEYPFGSRMHLGVVHPRLEARGRPFPRSPRSRSLVNPRVLRPLTRGPQGQPSALRTPQGRPGVQGILPTSRRQAPHGWPMVHHSMATGFQIRRGCCSVLSATPRPLVRNPATFHSPLPHYVNPSRPTPRVPCFPVLLGMFCGPSRTPFSVPSPFPIPHLVFIPRGAASTPVARAHWILIHPVTVSCALHGSLPSRPLLFGWFVSFRTCWGPFLLAPPPLPPVPVPIPHLVRCVFFSSRATRGPSSAPFARTLYPAACSLSAMRPPAVHCGFVLFFFRGLPPPLSHSVSCLVVSCPCRVRWFRFFYPPPCMHAGQHCTGHRVTAPLGVHLRSPRPRGACPMAVPGQARLGAPPLRHFPLFPLFSPLPSPPRHLSLVRPLTAVPLLCVLSAALLLARAVSRALSRTSRPLPCPASCRPTWAASPCTPSGGFPRRPLPPASPESVP